MLDADGRCWMRLTRLGGQALRRPRALRAAARPARLTPLSTPWRGADRALPGARPSRAGAWTRAWSRRSAPCGSRCWASRVLGRRERELFAALALPETPAARSGWPPAPQPRSASPSCSRATHGWSCCTRDIEILPDERGRPIVVCPALDGLGSAPAVSLTHAHGQAAALAAFAPAGAGVGIDVEPLRPRDRRVRGGGLDRGRAALLEPLAADAAEEWLLRMLVRARGGRQGARHGSAPAALRDRACPRSTEPRGAADRCGRPPAGGLDTPRRRPDRRDDARSGPGKRGAAMTTVDPRSCRRSSTCSRRRRGLGVRRRDRPGHAASSPTWAWSRWRSSSSRR